jgi:hypothetical protein
MTLDRIAPALFVLLWSTGWIVAKYASPHADPLTFLSMRFHARCRAVGRHHLHSAGPPGHRPAPAGATPFCPGCLLHGIYLGGVWWAISQGVPSSVSGLIAALQPLLTARAAPVIVGERLTASQKLGVLLGFAGLAVAIAATPAGARSIFMLQIALVPLAHQCFCHGVGHGGHDLPEALSAGGRPARHRFAAICRRLSCGHAPLALADRAPADRLEPGVLPRHGLVGAGPCRWFRSCCCSI